ncbi:hypothetical protein N9937_00685 [bacterium]|nr:hypothetical protein [bacterium]
MKAIQVQYSLFWKIQSASNVVVPNHNPSNWWECDVFRVTRSGFFYEYEVKVSRSDFFSEFKTKKRKHTQIKSGHTSGPSRFWYATPKGLVKIDEIPDYAGLVEINSCNRAVITKQAPRLHKAKATMKHLEGAMRSACWRVWTQMGDKIELMKAEQSKAAFSG